MTKDKTHGGSAWRRLGIGLLLAVLALAARAAPAVVYYVHSDHLDTPRLVTDGQARVVWRRTPLDEPFGTTPPEADPDGDGAAFMFNLRFPGQYFDGETNTNYNYFRDYDPTTGRYIQSDPIGLEGGINTYSYVRGNPLSFSDSLGLYTEVIQWGPDGSWSGGWGHISGNINGQNYSFGPNGWDTKRPSADDYAERQTEGIGRGGRGVVLDLTPEEESLLVACLNQSGKDYNPVSNNCGNPFRSCLQKLGIVDFTDKARVLPVDVYRQIRSSPRAVGKTRYGDATSRQPVQ